MQIRAKARRIQLLRAEYVPAQRDDRGNLVRGTGRATQKIVGTMSIIDTEIPEKLAEKLTDEEKAQVAAFLEERAKRLDLFELKEFTRKLPAMAASLGEQLGTVEITPEHAVGIFAGMKTLAQALHKAGFKEKLPPRPKKKAVSSRKPAPRPKGKGKKRR